MCPADVETARLVLRRWSERDLEPLTRLLAEPAVMRHITHEYGPLSRTQAAGAHAAYLTLWRERGFGPWAASDKTTGAWVGKIGLNLLPHWPGPHKVEVEWQLLPAFWGRGLAAEGGRAAIQRGFEDLRLDRIISVTVPANVASWRVMEKCGLLHQGRLFLTGPVTKRTREVVWYAIDRATWEMQRRGSLTMQTQSGRSRFGPRRTG